MSQGEINDHGKDLQHLTSTMVGKICEGAQKFESFFSSASIYRVPQYLRKHNESAYTPDLIAIGPLHRGDNHLKTPLQHVKMSYTNHLLSRLTAGMDLGSAEQTKFTVLQECLAELNKLVDRAKKCHAEEVTLDEEMMLVDGCFLLEFFYGYCTDTGPSPNPIANSFTFNKVRSDLVLLENQIPFFVVDELFHLILKKIPNRQEDWSLTDYVRWCYRYWMSPWPARNFIKSAFGDHRTAEYYHHILHNQLVQTQKDFEKTEQQDFDLRDMPSASELAYAGVKFVPDESGNHLFKFKFSEPQGLFRWFRRASFEIPPVPLVLYDSVESYLRNLIALEQCCPDVPRVVSTYAIVMDTLVNTEKDIEVLEEAGVLRNNLGATEDATLLFNKLCKEIGRGKYFFDTCSKATQHSKRFSPRNFAHVRRTYLASPWTFIAFCVGFIAFVMSVVQFIRDFFKKN